MSKADSKDRPGLIPRFNVLAYVFHSLGAHTGVTRAITEKQPIKIYKKKFLASQTIEFLKTHYTTHKHTEKHDSV